MKDSAAMTAPVGRIRELDGLRGLAILFVLIWHYATVQLMFVPVARDSVLDYLRRWTQLAWSGVDLFFVLSGFLIGGILMDNRDSPSYFSTFYVRRACRILPLYFVVLAAFVALLAVAPPSLAWLHTNPLPFWTYLTLTQNFAMGLADRFGPHWLSVTWSLAIEEQFYLFLPLLVRRIRGRQLAVSLVVLVAIGPISRIYLDRLSGYVFAFSRTDALMMGVLLAWLVRQPRALQYVQHRRRVLVGIVAGLTVLGAHFTLHDRLIGGPLNHFYLAILYGAALLLVVVYVGHAGTAALRSPALVWLGLRSYCLYLVHQPAVGLWHASPRRSSRARADDRGAGHDGRGLRAVLPLPRGPFSEVRAAVRL